MNDNRPKIMVVDDDKEILKSVALVFGPEYAVSLVPSGAEALEKLKDGELPDVILLDVCMPEMDGFEALKRIKSDGRTKHIPVIFLTGMTDTVDEYTGLQLGAVDYIRKPFSQDVLLLRLAMHLENAKKNALCRNERIRKVCPRNTERCRVECRFTHLRRLFGKRDL